MWYLIGAIVSALASLSCIVSTAVDFIKGKIKFTDTNLWGAIVFHLITGVLALWLFLKYSS